MTQPLTTADVHKVSSVLVAQSSAEPGSAASDNVHTSLDGPGEHQQTAPRENLNLRTGAAEDALKADGLSARLQDQPPGSAVTTPTSTELAIALTLAEPIQIHPTRIGNK